MRWSFFCNKVPGCRTAYLKRDSSTSVFLQILESFFRTAGQLLLELLLLFFSFVSFVVLTYVYEVLNEPINFHIITLIWRWLQIDKFIRKRNSFIFLKPFSILTPIDILTHSHIDILFTYYSPCFSFQSIRQGPSIFIPSKGLRWLEFKRLLQPFSIIFM